MTQSCSSYNDAFITDKTHWHSWRDLAFNTISHFHILFNYFWQWYSQTWKHLAYIKMSHTSTCLADWLGSIDQLISSFKYHHPHCDMTRSNRCRCPTRQMRMDEDACIIRNWTDKLTKREYHSLNTATRCFEIKRNFPKTLWDFVVLERWCA